MKLPALLIVGLPGSCQVASQAFLEDELLASMEILTRFRPKDALSLLSERQDIGVVLLLWAENQPQHLVSLVESLLAVAGDPFRAVMVRSRDALPADVMDKLWRMGVADNLYTQSIVSGDLVQSLITVVRGYQRNDTLKSVSISSGGLAKAKSLRELAELVMRPLHEQGIGRQGGVFCFLSDAVAPRLMVVAGTGIYSNLSSMPLERIDDPMAKEMLIQAWQRQQNLFAADAAVLYVKTPDEYVACIFLVLDKPLHRWEQGLMEVLVQAIALGIDQTQLAQRLLRTQHATITTMATLAEYRDVDTGEHVARVARAATEIAQALAERGGHDEIDASFVEQIGLASILHDIGKIAIAENVLMKPGSLDADERQIIQSHSLLGSDILQRAAKRSDNGELLSKAAEIARYHHEKYDGTGYPAGLKGEEIPLSARIIAVVDVFDALTSLRPYKEAWPAEQALALIRDGSGTHFDPQVVDAFLLMEERRKSAHFIVWTEAMSVGHPVLDFDHQRLIGIINRLWDADSFGNRQIIEFILDDLVNYTEFHFKREEEIIEQCGYPDLERHRRIHQGICRRIEEIRWEYFQGIRDELMNDILTFLTNWLKTHILEEDMGYSGYLSSLK